MKIEVSNGEIADKLSILEIKQKNIKDKDKLKHINVEYDLLNEAMITFLAKDHIFYQELLKINQKLWDIEDHIRDLERDKSFGKDFIQTARSVYVTNDQRSEVKRKINELTSSALFEEKSYEKY